MWKPWSFVKWSSFWVNSTTFDEGLSLNQPYLILFPLEIAIYINFIQFSCQICCDLRTFHGVNFGLKDLLCVKDMTFCNSGLKGTKIDFCLLITITLVWLPGAWHILANQMRPLRMWNSRYWLWINWNREKP